MSAADERARHSDLFFCGREDDGNIALVAVCSDNCCLAPIIDPTRATAFALGLPIQARIAWQIFKISSRSGGRFTKCVHGCTSLSNASSSRSCTRITSACMNNSSKHTSLHPFEFALIEAAEHAVRHTTIKFRIKAPRAGATYQSERHYKTLHYSNEVLNATSTRANLQQVPDHEAVSVVILQPRANLPCLRRLLNHDFQESGTHLNHRRLTPAPQSLL